MPIKLIVHVMGFAYFATSATADVNPPWWCFDTPDRGQFCGHYKASTAQLASVRATDKAEARMHIALYCVQSANNGIGAAVQVSREIGFEVIKSIAIIDNGSVHLFILIKVEYHNPQHRSRRRAIQTKFNDARAYERFLFKVKFSQLEPTGYMLSHQNYLYGHKGRSKIPNLQGYQYLWMIYRARSEALRNP